VALPAELSDWPSCTLSEAQQGDLELLTSGAFAPLRGYLDAADLDAIAERGTLADGTPWPLPVTLTVPARVFPDGASRLVLQDEEGSPLAVLAVTERRGPQIPDGAGNLDDPSAPGARISLAGPVTALRPPEHGPFRALRRRPEEVRAELSGGPVLAYATRRPLNQRHIGQLRHYAGQLNARLLVLPLVAGPAEIVTRPEALVRAVLAAQKHLPAGTLVIPVPLAPQAGPDADLRAQAIVAAAYGATHLLADAPETAGLPAAPRNGTVTLPGVPIPVISAGEWAYDPRSEVWRPLALIEAGAEQGELTDSEVGARLDAGAEVPAWFAPPTVTRELRRARPPRAQRGLAIFFTGLSGSGKSTIARGLAEALTERGDRTVSLLDGDQVRHLLSAGLTFSRADRDLNIARIGYVAAEVARHGGIAICAPIAPYAQARAAARELVSRVGDFLLVYVSTPVDVCAARDRKGLYAKARAGLIQGFTGVSDPYEEPRDADLVLDTSAMTRAQAVGAVLELLVQGGWLSPEPAEAGSASGSGGSGSHGAPSARVGSDRPGPDHTGTERPGPDRSGPDHTGTERPGPVLRLGPAIRRL
jgi:sulfate adenylyltransferase